MAEWSTAPCLLRGRGFEPRTSTNACGHVCRYVDRKGWAAMLTSIQSAGVTPEVNPRNSLHAGDKARKQGIHPGFETQGRRPKQGYQWPPPKNFKKKKLPIGGGLFCSVGWVHRTDCTAPLGCYSCRIPGFLGKDANIEAERFIYCTGKSSTGYFQWNLKWAGRDVTGKRKAEEEITAK